MKVRKLDEVCDFVSGLWTGKKPPYINVGVIRNTNFNKDGSLSFDDIAMLDVEVKQFSSRRLKHGDIILEKSGGGPKQPVGRVCVFEKNEGDYSLSNFTSAIRVKNSNELYYRYLHYYLFFLYASGETIKIQTNSTGIRNLQLTLYKDFNVPLPPLATQQKIVNKLDAIFVEIERACAATEANAKNAEALYKSYLDEIFTSNTSEYKELNLLDVTDVITCGVAKRPDYVETGIPFLSARNVKNGVMKWDRFEYISKDTHEALSKYNKPKIGDILYSRVGAGFGDAAIIDRDLEFSIFVSLTLLKTKPLLLNTYLRDYLNSPFIKKIAKENITGTGVGNLNVGAVRKFPIKLPPLEKQNEIVKKIEVCNLLTSNALNTYKIKLEQINLFKQSILKQAFNGELVKD